MKRNRVVVFWLGFCTGTAWGFRGFTPVQSTSTVAGTWNLFFRFDVFTFSPNSVRQVLISLTSRSLFLVLRAAPSPSTQYLSSFLRSTVTPREKVSCKTIASLASLSFPSSRSLVQDIDLKSIRFASLSKKDHQPAQLIAWQSSVMARFSIATIISTLAIAESYNVLPSRRLQSCSLQMSNYESQVLAAQPTIEEWLDVAEPGLKKATLAMFRSVKEIAYKIRTASCDKMSCFNDYGK